MSTFSQSKSASSVTRGPLIAVIKIQLDSQNVDRIFLHLNDDDQELAQQFVLKHCLNPALKIHIFQRIQLSRQAIESQNKQLQYEMTSYRQNYDGQFRTPKHSYEPQHPEHQQNQPGQFLKKSQNGFHHENEQAEDLTGTFQEPFARQTFSAHQNPSKQTSSNLLAKSHTSGHNIFYSDSEKGLSEIQQDFKQWPQGNGKEKKFQDVEGSWSRDLTSKRNISNQATNTSSLIYKKRSSDLYDISGLKLNKGNFHSKENNLPNLPNFQHSSSSSSHQEPLFQRVIQGNRTKGQGYEIQEFVEIPEPQILEPETLSTGVSSKIDRESILQKLRSSELLRSSPVRREGPKDFSKPLIQSQVKIKQKNSQQISSTRQQVGTIKPNSKHLSSNSIINSLSKSPNTFSSNVYKPSDTSPYRSKLNTNQREQFFTETTKFNHERLFHDIEDIKHLQQNRHYNFNDTNTNRNVKLEKQGKPSGVKFISKDELARFRSSSITSSASRSQLCRISAEVTSRLYNEADIKQKYLDWVKQRAKNGKIEEVNEDRQLTLRPQINALSHTLAARRKKDDQTLEDYLVSEGQRIQAKKQEMADQQARQVLQNCSFQPQINDLSHKLAKSRSKSRVSTSLAKGSRTSQSSHNFRPSINKLSNEIAKSKGSFIERQQKFQAEKTLKHYKRVQEQRKKQKADPFSGQTLYHPQVSQRSTVLASKNSNRPSHIHNYLFELSKQPKPQDIPVQISLINSQSEKLVSQMHQKRLIWLFSQLDSDQDGMISSKRICIEQISTQILEIIAPVLYEMEELNTQLNLQDFKNAIQILHKSLDPHEKSILYNYHCKSPRP